MWSHQQAEINLLLLWGLGESIHLVTQDRPGLRANQPETGEGSISQGMGIAPLQQISVESSTHQQILVNRGLRCEIPPRYFTRTRIN